MSEISVNTLMLAITSMYREIDWTVQRIKEESPEIDEQEGLSEHVLDLQKALNELANQYEKQRVNEPVYPSFDELI